MDETNIKQTKKTITEFLTPHLKLETRTKTEERKGETQTLKKTNKNKIGDAERGDITTKGRGSEETIQLGEGEGRHDTTSGGRKTCQAKQKIQTQGLTRLTDNNQGTRGTGLGNRGRGRRPNELED